MRWMTWQLLFISPSEQAAMQQREAELMQRRHNQEMTLKREALQRKRMVGTVWTVLAPSTNAHLTLISGVKWHHMTRRAVSISPYRMAKSGQSMGSVKSTGAGGSDGGGSGRASLDQPQHGEPTNKPLSAHHLQSGQSTGMKPTPSKSTLQGPPPPGATPPGSPLHQYQQQQQQQQHYAEYNPQQARDQQLQHSHQQQHHQHQQQQQPQLGGEAAYSHPALGHSATVRTDGWCSPRHHMDSARHVIKIKWHPMTWQALSISPANSKP